MATKLESLGGGTGIQELLEAMPRREESRTGCTGKRPVQSWGSPCLEGPSALGFTVCSIFTLLIILNKGPHIFICNAPRKLGSWFWAEVREEQGSGMKQLRRATLRDKERERNLDQGRAAARESEGGGERWAAEALEGRTGPLSAVSV